MNISIIGSGYVGLVTGASLARLGNNVICVDDDEGKIRLLNSGKMPIYEPGLKELIVANVKNKRIRFITSIKEAVENSQIIFITVGTPTLENGEADLSNIEKVVREVAIHLKGYRLIVEKSTVPVQTGEWIKRMISAYAKKNAAFDVASNPEFLSEGTALRDFMHPDRIVIGAESRKAADLLTKLYRPINAPVLVTDIKSAELIKHASNSFLAARISFVNALSQICELAGADITEVARGMGMDKRVGSRFLNAGIGYGGFCLPKDLDAFVAISRKLGYDFNLLKCVKSVNEEQKYFVLRKIRKLLKSIKGKSISILGLSFKPDTDDIRFAPALDLIRLLRNEGARIKAYDPQAMHKAKTALKGVELCKDPYSAVKGADCVIMATEWQEFKELDFKKVKRLVKNPFILDGRNIYDPNEMKKLGFIYSGIGR